jgi:hypothetical protein
MKALQRAGLLLLGAVGVGCGFQAKALVDVWQDGEFVEVQVLDLAEDEDAADIRTGTFIGKVGPGNVGAGEYSGATYDFEGTGDRVCVIVDPQSVFRDDVQLDDDGTEWNNPFFDDFPHDDGDIDLQVGLASFYTGTPGQTMGDFFASFPDSNGIDRAVDLNLCLQEDNHGVIGGHAGRATPEWCDLETQVGVTYRLALTVFSVPADDRELTYALEVRDGACPANIDECTVRGDVDYSEGDEDLFPWPGVSTVEHMHCDALD